MVKDGAKIKSIFSHDKVRSLVRVVNDYADTVSEWSTTTPTPCPCGQRLHRHRVRVVNDYADIMSA